MNRLLGESATAATKFSNVVGNTFRYRFSTRTHDQSCAIQKSPDEQHIWLAAVDANPN